MRRCYSINEILLRLVSQRIAAECNTMVKLGADITQVNAILPDVIRYHDQWREEMLAEMMAELDELNRLPRDPAPLTPLRRN